MSDVAGADTDKASRNLVILDLEITFVVVSEKASGFAEAHVAHTNQGFTQIQQQFPSAGALNLKCSLL